MVYIQDALHLQIQADLRFLRWQWQGPVQLAGFQEAFDQLLTYSVRHGITHMLADTSTMPPVGADEQAWLSEEWLPRSRCLPLRQLALVLPCSLHNQLVVENVIHHARFYLHAHVHFFSDSHSAFDFIMGGCSGAAGLEQEWCARCPHGCRPRPRLSS